MANPAKFRKPFITKIGFFTNKGYVVSLFFVLFFDYIYVLIFGTDKWQVILFGLPYTVTILVFYHLIFIGGLYLFSKIKSLFGIDFAANQHEQDLSAAQLSPLFAENGFHGFQDYTYNQFNRRWITYVAIFLAAFLTFIMLWAPIFLFQEDEWISAFPELAENGLYYIYLVFRLGPLSLFMFWLFFSIFSLLFLIIELMIIFNAMGNFSGLSLSKISEYFDNSISSENPIAVSQDSEVVQFSLKRFRRKCKIIPEMVLKINLGVVLGSFILGILFLTYISNVKQEEARNFAISLFFLLISVIMLFNLVIFIFPQLSLHRHLERTRNFLMGKFEEIYEIKRFQYLNIAFVNNLEGKELLLAELQTLNQMLDEIEDVITWPFNYNQLTTLLVGSIVLFLPLIIELLLSA